MISVIFPARGRPKELKASLDSLYEMAAKPDDIDILVAVDDDELVSAAEPQFYPRFRVWIGPRKGYANIHLYYNELAVRAKGDHILIWNDDTRMLTKDWDQLLSAGPKFSMQFLRRDTVKTSDFTFWSMSRSVYEVIGCVSPQPAPDLFASHVAQYSGIAVVRNDIVFHHECLPAVGRQAHPPYDPHAPKRRAERLKAIESIEIVPKPHWISGKKLDLIHVNNGLPCGYYGERRPVAVDFAP